MKAIRGSIIGLTICALGITSMAAPVSAAATGRLILVNGVPGKTVEMCVNNKEVAKKVKYGRHVIRRQSPGTKIVKFKKASAGTCTGKLLGKSSVLLGDGEERVVVVTKRIPLKVVAFPALVGSAGQVFRHAADIGTAGFKRIDPDTGTPWFPAADEPFEKGDWGSGSGWSTVPPHVWWAHQPPSQVPIAGPFTGQYTAGVRYEHILVGSTLANVRFVNVKYAKPGAT
jgi:hypothetical protein